VAWLETVWAAGVAVALIQVKSGRVFGNGPIHRRNDPGPRGGVKSPASRPPRTESPMFTGIIQAVGRLAAREHRGGDQRLTLAWGDLPHADIALGESIAVNGCCLTVVAFDEAGWAADVSNETLALTTLGALAVGAAVNFERSLRPTDRLGGHLVAGHVDAVGAVVSIAEDARSQRWRFAAPASLLRYVANKGSIAIDGVSLTVNAVDSDGFEVNLVPHTIVHTAFAATPVGAAVNLEADTVARYVERLLSARGETA
jgi:riboflavin synthase